MIVVKKSLQYNAKNNTQIIQTNQTRYNNNNNNNGTCFDLQFVNSPIKLRFEANLSRENSQCTEQLKPEIISYMKDNLSRKSLIQ